MENFSPPIRSLGSVFPAIRYIAFFLGLFPFFCSASYVRVAIPSEGLAFSAAQVGAVGYAARQRVLTEVARAELTGCLSYCEVLASVWAALTPVFQAQHDDLDLRLVVLRSPDITALSFADGTVVISEVLIADQGLDEAQIAFVLAHEASHILLQHERQTLTSMMALMPSTYERHPEDVYAEIEYRYFADSESLSIIFQQAELEADEIGLQLAAMARFAPHLQLKFMEQRTTKTADADIFATHPPATDRLLRLRDQMPLAIRLFQLGKE